MLSRDLERRISKATDFAKKSKHEFVTVEHLFLFLLESPVTVEILESCQVDVQKLKKELRTHLTNTSPVINEEQLEAYGGYESWNPEFTLACHRWIQRAAMQVKNSGKNSINEGVLLIALFYERESQAAYLLSQQNLTQFDVINFVSHGIAKSEDGNNASMQRIEGQDAAGGASSGSSKSALESYCVNMNERVQAGKVDPLVGRENEIERIVLTLMRRSKNNPLLVGEPGVGKTAIVEGLAQRLVEGRVPQGLRDKIIYSLDLGSLLAGTKFRGDFEGRIKAIVSELQNRKNCILFIDEIHTLIGAGATSGGSLDASNLLKQPLSLGEITCIGSTTQNELRQHFEKDRALNRRFQKIEILEPSTEDALQILKGLKSRFEEFHNVEYTSDALSAAVELSQKHIHQKLLPDKAIDVLDEAGAKAAADRVATDKASASSATAKADDNSSDVVKTDADTDNAEIKDVETNEVEMRKPSFAPRSLVDSEAIARTVARMTGLPVSALSSSEKIQLRDLDKKLKALVFGQDEAIDKLVTAIKLARSGLNRHEKPIGSFLFVGPTGVGKTEVSKQLALVMGLSFHRFDMSEYMEKHAVARLVGAPPGYVGYESGGLLTEAITKSPYSVLLLDEIEKAHPDVLNSLLQVMDAGRLTDGQGRVADFKNCVLIMTSNAGAVEMAKGTIGLVESSAPAEQMDLVKRNFTPEFLNRLDSVVPFKHLSEEELVKVVQKFVDEIRMALAEKKVDLQVSSEVLQWLMKKGYDRAYGARPMARTIDEHLKKPLVDELLFGRLVDGGKVIVSLEKGSLQFSFIAAANIPAKSDGGDTLGGLPGSPNDGPKKSAKHKLKTSPSSSDSSADSSGEEVVQGRKRAT